MAEKKTIEWRGITLLETAGGRFEGSSMGATAVLNRQRNNTWDGLVNCMQNQWTACAKTPEEVLEILDRKINGMRDFLLGSQKSTEPAKSAAA